MELRPKAFIDYQDANDRWQTAFILEVSEKEAYLQLEGQERTVWLSTKSQRLAPFRRYSVASSTSSFTALWSLSLSSLQDFAGKFNYVQSLSAGAVTQFLRGEMVYRLVAAVQQGADCEDSEAQFLFRGVLMPAMRLVLGWLQRLSNMYQDFYTAQANPEAYLTDSGIALAMAYRELSLCLRVLLGEEPATAQALQRFDQAHYSRSFAFWSRSSLDYVNEMLRDYGPISLLPLLEDLSIPLEILAYLPIGPLCKYLLASDESDLPRYFEAVLARISTLSERDIKDYDQQVKKLIIGHLADLQKLMRLEDYKVLRKVELEVSLKLLKSNFLEKRIRGLNEIKEMIEESSKAKGGYFWTSKSTSLDTSDLVDWLSSSHVLTILSECAHAELLKRSHEIYELMGIKHRLTLEQLTALWQSLEHKHESYVREVYELVAKMPAWMTAQETRNLYELITSPGQEKDEKYLSLIKDFSVAALNVRNQADYGAELLFGLTINEQNDQALKSLIALLTECQSSSKRQAYLERALKCFTEDVAVPQCLQLALALLEKFPAYDQATLLAQYNRKQLLVTSLTSSINGYTEITRERHITEDTVTADKTLHSKHLRLRFTLLALLILRGGLIETANLDVIWKATVVNPVLKSDSKVMYSWILWVTDGVKGLGVEECIHMLEYFESGKSFDMSQATSESFEAFYKLFLIVNKGRSLEIRGNTILRRLDLKVTGFETALNFALNSEAEDVSGSAMAVVLECCVLLSSRVSKPDLWTQLSTHLLQVLSEPHSSRTNRALKLCQFLIDLQVPVPAFDSKAAKMTLHLALPASRSERLVVPSDISLGQLRRKVAEIVRTHPTKIRLRWTRVYNDDEDDLPIHKVLAYNASIAVEVVRNLVDEVRPQELLATEGLYDCLFSLATHPESAHFAWELLLKLPYNRRLKRDLEKMNSTAFQPPTPQTFHKCLYSLMGIAEFCQNPDYADRFLSNETCQNMIKSVFEMDVSTLGCSGLMLVKFIEVVITHIRKLLKRHSALFDTATVLTQGLNLLYFVSKNLEKGSEKAVDEIRGLFVDSYSEGQSGLFESVITAHPKLKETLLAAILQCEFSDIRVSTSNLVLQLSRSPFYLSSVFLKIMLELLLFAQEERHSFCYFQVTSKLVKSAGIHFRDVLEESSKHLFDMMQEKEEQSADKRDEGLLGSLKLLHSIGKTLNLSSPPSDLETFLQRCILDMPPVCKHHDTRKMAYKVLFGMTMRTAGAIDLLLPHFTRLYEDPRWRTGRLSAWEVSPSHGERSLSGFVGIRNSGCLCYMISALQQLYLVRSFRSFLLNLDLSAAENPESSLLWVCQRIFAGLQYSSKQCISIKRLCRVLEGSSVINVNEQMDAEEFLNAFMDQLERQLGTNKAVIGDHFGGQLATEIIGKGNCSHSSERIEAFLTLPLEVKNKKSLIESLESLVNGETLEGDNAYQCDLCNAKVTAQRRIGLRHLPNILIVALRRFDYNLDTMRRMKLNNYYEFPWEIDLEPYTIEGLHRKDNEQTGNPHTSGPLFPANYYQFRLRGVVIHTGSAEGGHYYSYIQDRASSKWFEFNDTIVREVDPFDIPSEAFGGEEKFKKSSYYGDTVEVQEKVTNAYLLIYERMGIYSQREHAEKQLKEMVLPAEMPEGQSTSAIVAKIVEKNKTNWLRKNAFADTFVHFVISLSKEQIAHLSVFKLALSVFLTVICRTKENSAIQAIFPELQRAVGSSQEAAKWLVEVFSYPEVTQELLLVCPHSYIRRLFTTLLRSAVGPLTPEIRLIALERVLLKLEQAKQSQQFTQYFELIYLLVNGLQLPSDLNLAEMLIAFLGGRPLPVYQREAAIAAETRDISLGYADYQPPPDHYSTVPPLKPPCVGYILATLAVVPLTSSQRHELLYPALFKECVFKLEGKAGGRLAGRFYASLVKGDEAVSRQILSLVINGVKESSATLIKTYFRILSPILSLTDSLREDRIHTVLSDLSLLMKESSAGKEKTHTELIGLFIYKQTTINEYIRHWVFVNSKRFVWVEDWIRRWASSSHYITDIMDQSVARRLRALSQSRLSLSGDDWDSDEDVELRAASKVLIYNPYKCVWEYAMVVESLGPVARVKGEGAAMWVESDSEDLRPYH